MRYCNKNKLMAIVLISVLWAINPICLYGASAKKINEIRRIKSIEVEQVEYGTSVRVSGSSEITDYNYFTIDSPPRIVIDIPSYGDRYGSRNMPLKDSNLRGIRLGYHKNVIRLVMDIRRRELPVFNVTSTGEELIIFLRSLEQLKERKANFFREILSSEKDQKTPEILSGIEPGSKKEGGSYLLKAIESYKSENWKSAVNNLHQLIKEHPESSCRERAYFLLAKSYEHLYEGAVSEHFMELRMLYEDAVNRYPESPYVPDALLSIGNLCFENKNYYEAMGYYNLLFKKYEKSLETLNALMQKVKILHIKEKRKEAISILKYIITEYPGTTQEIEAKIKMAQLLYEMNSFRKSTEILKGIEAAHPECLYKHLEISLYLGYNFYQLGDFAGARKGLFRFYNSCPQDKDSHLILTKIADTYHEEGLTDEAVKLYQLVLERYPDTEGALISLIRLAEKQEKGELHINRGLISPVRAVGMKINLPREIYQEILENIREKDKESPLAQLALLKLAILYAREETYEKSLDNLKELIEKYPKTSLKKEILHALEGTLEGMLKKRKENKNYTGIINIYHRNESLFARLDSPMPFLLIGEAALNLGLKDMAASMYKRADPYLLRKEKPPDVLFFAGREFFEEGRINDSLERLDILTENFPSSKYAKDAYELKGKIHFHKKNYQQAADMYDSALRYSTGRCERVSVMVKKARTLAAGSITEKALGEMAKVKRLKRDCQVFYPLINQEIGDVYLRVGQPERALVAFKQALQMEKDEADRTRIKFQMAECYRAMDKKKECISLYSEVSGKEDAFWSKLAREKIEEIEFKKELEGAGNQKPR